jgi:V/A-type H+/Na+-transporting ATPase subunit G/H
MARDDILSKIKQAESDANASVQMAMEDKDKKLAAATTEAGNIVKIAEAEAKDFYDKSLAKTAEEIKNKKQSIIQSGNANVSTLNNKAIANLDKAVEHLMKEFMRLLHA